jgi:hypothetical protein
MSDATAAPNDNGNGRVTLALLGAKLDNIDRKLDDYMRRNDEEFHDHEKRIRTLETDGTRIKTLLGGWNVFVTALTAWLLSGGQR